MRSISILIPVGKSRHCDARSLKTARNFRPTPVVDPLVMHVILAQSITGRLKSSVRLNASFTYKHDHLVIQSR